MQTSVQEVKSHIAKTTNHITHGRCAMNAFRSVCESDCTAFESLASYDSASNIILGSLRARGWWWK
jgi:hypothetical protein